MTILLTRKEIEDMGIYLDNINAAINPNGVAEIWFGKNKIPPWERDETKRNIRHSRWRESIFIRDNFTCLLCGQVGGSLCAHHIKSYKKYKRLRYKIDNGITLCKKCHKKIHKEINEGLDKHI